MPPLLKLGLFLLGLVVFTGLLAAGGSGWRAGWQAFRSFGIWIAVLLAFGLVTFMAA